MLELAKQVEPLKHRFARGAVKSMRDQSYPLRIDPRCARSTEGREACSVRVRFSLSRQKLDQINAR